MVISIIDILLLAIVIYMPQWLLIIVVAPLAAICTLSAFKNRKVSDLTYEQKNIYYEKNRDSFLSACGYKEIK